MKILKVNLLFVLFFAQQVHAQKNTAIELEYNFMYTTNMYSTNFKFKPKNTIFNIGIGYGTISKDSFNILNFPMSLTKQWNKTVFKLEYGIGLNNYFIQNKFYTDFTFILKPKVKIINNVFLQGQFYPILSPRNLSLDFSGGAGLEISF